MYSNNRKSYLKSGKKRYALSRVIFAFRAIIFVNCQADKKIKMQDLEEALEVKC